MTSAGLTYLHDCNPPPVDVEQPDRIRWFCPDCGTPWLFVRSEDATGRATGRWKELSYPARERPQRQVDAVRAVLDSWTHRTDTDHYVHLLIEDVRDALDATL